MLRAESVNLALQGTANALYQPSSGSTTTSSDSEYMDYEVWAYTKLALVRVYEDAIQPLN